MFKKIHFPSPLSILMIVIILAALATWMAPAGKYNTLAFENNLFVLETPDTTIQIEASQQVLDSLKIKIALTKFQNGDIRKPVSIPGTYQYLDQNGQKILEILQAPVKGMYETIDIIFLVLFIGGFIHVFSASGAIDKGIAVLCYKMKGKENWLIIIMTFLFALGGTTFGMAEEGMAFYPLLVPVFLAAGFDLIVPVAVIFIGTSVGNLSSITNPFATIIASNAAGINWTNGINGRLLLFILTTGVTIMYTIRYAQKVKNNPALSLVVRFEGNVQSPFHAPTTSGETIRLDRRTGLILLLFLITFIIMVTGVVIWDWWLLEMTTLFLASTLLLGFLLRMNEKKFIHHFIKGAESLLSVAMIIGVARGVTIILNDGRVSGTILFYCSNAVQGMPPAFFIVALLFVYMLLTLFISSSSGMAVLTMPIIGPLAAVVGVPGEQIVNAYLFGMGIMGFITPVGLILPALAMVNVSFITWLRFIWPLVVIITTICILFLIAGVI